MIVWIVTWFKPDGTVTTVDVFPFSNLPGKNQPPEMPGEHIPVHTFAPGMKITCQLVVGQAILPVWEKVF